jgi:sulfonate transport system permease protein
MRAILERLLPFILPAALFALWIVSTGSGSAPDALLVPPGRVWVALVGLIENGELLDSLGVSLRRLLSGFISGSVLGLVFGVLIALFRPLDEAASPTFQFIRQIPSVVFIPVFILLFGVQELFKIAIVAKAAFFPVALAVYDAIRNLSVRHLEVASVYRLTHSQLVWNVMLPATVPSLLSGLRISLSRSWLLLVAAELLAADSGIGYMMQMGRQMFRIDLVMVGVLLTGTIGFLIDQSFRVAEKRLVRWRAT